MSDELRQKRRELYLEGRTLACVPPIMFSLFSLVAWLAGDTRTDMLVAMPFVGLYGGCAFFLAATRFYDPPPSKTR